MRYFSKRAFLVMAAVLAAASVQAKVTTVNVTKDYTKDINVSSGHTSAGYYMNNYQYTVTVPKGYSAEIVLLKKDASVYNCNASCRLYATGGMSLSGDALFASEEVWQVSKTTKIAICGRIDSVDSLTVGYWTAPTVLGNYEIRFPMTSLATTYLYAATVRVKVRYYKGKPRSSVTVKYDSRGGSVGYPSYTYTVGEKYMTTSYSERPGYIFTGWYTAASGGEQVTNLSRVSAAVSVLYAHWKAITYTVAFDGNGATSGSMASQGFTGGKKAALRKNAFKRTGMSFQGWARSQAEADAGTVRWKNAQTVKNLTTNNGGTVKLYAVWKAKSYAVTVNLTPYNGGTVSGAGKKRYGSTVTLTAKPKKGYYFLGWYTSKGKTLSSLVADNRASVTTFTMPASAQTLVAKFKKGTAPATTTMTTGGTTTGTTTGNTSNTGTDMTDNGTLPAWAIGSFEGYITDGTSYGCATFSVTSTGKISGKVNLAGGSYMSFSSDAYTVTNRTAGTYAYSPVVMLKGEFVRLTFTVRRVSSAFEWGMATVSGASVTAGSSTTITGELGECGNFFQAGGSLYGKVSSYSYTVPYNERADWGLAVTDSLSIVGYDAERLQAVFVKSNTRSTVIGHLFFVGYNATTGKATFRCAWVSTLYSWVSTWTF